MSLLEKLFELIFPPRCIFCNEIMSGSRCSCLDRVIETNRLSGHERECAKDIKGMDLAVSSFIYRGTVPDAIYRFKFRGYFMAARELAKYMAEDIADYPEIMKCDCIVPVPSYRNRSNHGRILADCLSLKTGIPVRHDLVVKIRKTQKQHEISYTERKANLKDAYRVSEDAKGLNVLICDDVLTSGETLSNLSLEFKDKGAVKVYGATFSRASK